MGGGRRPPTAPTATGAKAPTAPAVRPKKLYRADAKNRDDKPAVSVKFAAKVAAGKPQGAGVSRDALRAVASAAGLHATGKSVPIAQLSRKELQVRIRSRIAPLAHAIERQQRNKTGGRSSHPSLGTILLAPCLSPLWFLRSRTQALAIKKGLKANAKSAELVAALEQMESSATAGAALFMKPLPVGASELKERTEVEELKALFGGGKTPGGGKARQAGATPGGTKWRLKATTYNLRSKAATGEVFSL